MMKKRITFLVLCFQTINWAASADLKNPLILNKNGDEIFFPRYVKKTDDGTKLIYVEPGNESTSTYTFCNSSSFREPLEGILLEKSAKRTCSSKLNLSRELIKDEDKQPIPCGDPDDGYKKYKAYYELSIDNLRFTHSLYEYCFEDKEIKNMLYAHYDVDNPSLLGNQLLAEEQNHEFNLENPSLEGSANDTGISVAFRKQLAYIRQEVAVSEFIPFGQWKSAFSQWHNSAAMNKNLIKPWKRFLKNIKSKLAQKSEPIKVYSGVYDPRRINGELQYLSNGRTEIPSFWWIALYNKDKTHGVSLIMHNYAYNTGEKKLDPLCGESICGRVGLEGAVPQGPGYNQASIYCCPASTISTKINIFEDNGLFMFHEGLSASN